MIFRFVVAPCSIVVFEGVPKIKQSSRLKEFFHHPPSPAQPPPSSSFARSTQINCSGGPGQGAGLVDQPGRRSRGNRNALHRPVLHRVLLAVRRWLWPRFCRSAHEAAQQGTGEFGFTLLNIFLFGFPAAGCKKSGNTYLPITESLPENTTCLHDLQRSNNPDRPPGDIVEIGAAVRGFEVGDAVYGQSLFGATLAEYAVIKVR